MTSLRQALGATPQSTSLNTQLGGPVLSPEEVENRNAAAFAYNSGALRQGVQRGLRGLISPTDAYVGANLEANGRPDLAQQAYAQSQREAELSAIESPDIPTWQQAHGLGGVARFVAGNVGAMAPMMASSLVAGGLGRAVGGTAGSMLAGTAAMHPVMAGSAVERMRADPVTAALSPQERLSSANTEGLGAAALYAAVPTLMQGRAVGAAGLAAKPALNPLRTLGGIAGDTGVAMAGMGASNVAVGELGRSMQRGYNPAYQPEGGDEAARTEEFMSGAAGVAPHALAHGAMAHTLGAMREPGQSLLGAAGDAAKAGAGMVWDGTKWVANKAVPIAGKGVDAARDLAAQIHDDYRAGVDASEEGGPAAVMNGVAAAAGHQVGKVAAAVTSSYEASVDKTRPQLDALKEKLDALKEKLGILNNPGDDATAQSTSHEVIADAARLADEHSINTPDAQTVRDLSQKQGVLSEVDQQNLERAAKNVAKNVADVADVAEVSAGFDSFLGAQKSDETGPHSRQGTRKATNDADHSQVEDAFAKAGVHPAAFHEGVGTIVDKMMAGHPAASYPAQAAKAKAAFTTVFDGMAAGGEHTKRARQFAQFITSAFGEKGGTALTELVDLAKLRYGDKSKEAGRVGYMGEHARSVSSVAAALRPLLKKGVLPEGASAAKVLDGLLHDLRNAEGEDTARPRKSEVQAVLDEADRYQASGDVDSAMKLRKAASEMNSNATGVKSLPGKWTHLIAPGKHDSVMAILQAYKNHPERLNKPETKAPNVSATAANHAAEFDDNADSHGAARRQAEDGDAIEMREKKENETGEHGTFQAGPVFHGAGALEEGGHKAGVQAPLSRHPSVDHPGGMFNAAVEAAHAKYGHRVADAAWVSMQAWAKEESVRTGVSVKKLLDQAMDKTLEHDQQRLTKLKALEKSGKNTTEDVKWINARAEQAAQHKADAQGHPGASAGESFFDEKGPQRGYGYYRMEQSDGANLKLSGDTLERAYAPREHETDKGYAARMRAKDGGALSKAAYENSMLPVVMADGRTVSVDIAKLVGDSMRRHQAGDVEGVGDNARSNRVDAQGAKEDVASGDFAKGLMNAVHTVAAAIMDAKGVDGDNAFGHQTGEGKLHTALGAKGNASKPRGAERTSDTEVQFFDKSLVVYRDVANGRVITYGQLSKMADVNPHTFQQMKSGVVKVEVGGKTKHTETTPGVMDKAAVSNLVKPTSDKGVKAGAEGGASKDAATKGVVRGLLTDADGVKHDLNLRGLLAHMLERNGIDASEALREADPTNKLASMLLREGLTELEAHGYKADFTSYGKDDARSNQNDAVLFKRTGADDTTYPVTWGDLKKEAHPDVSVTTPRDIQGAKLDELSGTLKKFEAEAKDRAGRIKRDELRNSDLTQNPREERALREDAKNKGIEALDDNPWPVGSHEEERIKSLFRDVAKDNGGEGTLFDKSVAQLFEARATEREGVKLPPEERAKLAKDSAARIEALQAQVEALTGSKEGLTEKVMDKQLGSRNPDPVREGFTELVDKTPIPKPMGDAPKPTVKTEVLSAVDRRAAAAVGAKENVAALRAKEKAPVLGTLVGKEKQARPVESEAKVTGTEGKSAFDPAATVARMNTPDVVTKPLEVLSLLSGLSDKEKQSLADTLPALRDAKGNGAKLLIRKLKEAGFEVNDDPFSKQGTLDEADYLKRITGWHTLPDGRTLAEIGKFGPIERAGINVTRLEKGDYMLEVYDMDLVRQRVSPSKAVVETFMLDKGHNNISEVHTNGVGNSSSAVISKYRGQLSQLKVKGHNGAYIKFAEGSFSHGEIRDAFRVLRDSAIEGGDFTNVAGVQIRRGTGWNPGAKPRILSRERALAFSKQETTNSTLGRFEKELRVELDKHKQSLIGDALGYTLKMGHLGEGISGKLDTAAKEMMINFAARDLIGSTRHESWHVVEEVLKTMGPHGQRILDAVYKHTDTPLMRRWLEAHYAGDEGVMGQISGGKNQQRERAAFAFQAFMNGDGVMPLHSETRSVWQKVKDWVKDLVGISADGKHAESFFKYVADSGFLRDMDNPEAVLRGLAETKSDRFVKSVHEGVKPIQEAVGTVFTGTAARLTKLGVPGYDAVRTMYEGAKGKAGYNAALTTARYKWGNMFAEQLKGKTPAEMSKQMLTPEYKNVLEKFRQYFVADEHGLTDANFKNLLKRTESYSQDLVDKHLTEFTNDLIKHGGLPADKAGDARLIAQNIADMGYHYDPDLSLFADAPAIKAKWETKDPSEMDSRLVHIGTRMVERAIAFGPKDERLNAALKAGDAMATADGRKLARGFMSAYEGTLGADIAPGTKKAMSILMVANNLRILPMAVFSQMLEPMQLAFRKNDFSSIMDPLFRGIKEMPRAFDKINDNWTKDQWETLAEQIGAVASDHLGSTLTQMHTGFAMKGLAGKINEKFFKYTFQEQWNRSMHIAATKHAVEFLKENAAAVRDGTGKHSERFLSALGLKEGDVKVDASKGLVLNDKVEKALVQYVNEAMAHPDAGSNPLWMNDQRFSLLSQMKRFTFAHSRYVLSRGVDEYKHGNLAVLAPAVLAVPWLMASDGIRDMINPFSDTSYKNNWTYTDYLMHGIERTGATGRMQFPIDMESSIAHGGTGIEGFGGPSVELFGRITRGAKTGHMLDAMINGVPGAPLIMPD